MKVLRVLVTGSRDWAKESMVHLVLNYVLSMALEHGYSLEIVHGGCPTGADFFAKRWVDQMKMMGFPVDEDPHPADWKRYGLGAGYRRNAEMIHGGVDLCLAFIHNESQGSSRTADLAEKYYIETQRYTSGKGSENGQ